MDCRFNFSSLAQVGLLFVLTVGASPAPALARKHTPVTDVTVVVADAASHKPVFQARLTLEFRDPLSHVGRRVSYNAKTDAQGKYKFSFIPMEPVFLTVTDPHHQSFGRQFEVTQEDQVIHVNLNPPQPLR